MNHCPGCRCFAAAFVPREQAIPVAEQVVKRYGSVRRAGAAYAERHGLSASAGVRFITRVRHGPQRFVLDSTLDRLEVML